MAGVDSSLKISCQNKRCESLGKKMAPSNFFTSRNPSFSHHPYCKYCVENMIDRNNLETVYDVLKLLDIPFIINVWNDVCRKKKSNYMEYYLKEMNGKEYKDKKYEDSVFILNEEDSVENEIPKSVQGMIDDEEMIWSPEWNGNYTAKDLEYLNNYYNGLTDDFKIVTTNHKDYAKKIAQASLFQSKAYQNLLKGEDGADLAYEKATKMFDQLSKSAQFAESQRSANDVSLGCFGRVFDAVEKHTWVPTHEPENKDMYDKLLKQFSNIEKSLE